MRRWGAFRINAASAVAWGTVAGLVLLQLLHYGMPFGVWVEAHSRQVTMAIEIVFGVALLLKGGSKLLHF